ncbi:FAD-dependent oxidoreductase [Chloroflexota bacterium]
MTQLKMLFEPIEIGNFQVRNRIVMPGVHTNYNATHLKDFYTELAIGGVGLITAGGFFISNPGLNVDQLGLYKDEDIPGLRELAEAAHVSGAKIVAQVTSRFWLLKPSGERDLVGPSAVVINPRGGPRSRELTIDEIEQITMMFAEAARKAKIAGFDGIEFHCGIGGLINQFISPYTNKRQDEYGGSLEKRMCFVLRIIAETQRKAGKDFSILTRISGADFMEGGHTLEDTKKVAPILEQAGVCALIMNTGWHEASVPTFHACVPRGHWVYLAEEIKQVVSIPVVTGTRILDPVMANRIIKEGQADMVYMARALIADPDLPNKAREGKFNEMRPCISCCYCFDVAHSALQPMACSVNAMVGREAEFPVTPASTSKKVVIVGGGVAGMQAAQTAAWRGHSVILLENNDKLGGQLLLAAIPPYKQEISYLTEYLSRQMYKLGVEVKLNQDVTVRDIEDMNPDAVIIATGSQPVIPDFPGMNGENVVKATEILTGVRKAGDRVVVIGGGMVGCETADFLAAKGKKVTILEMMEHIANDVERTVRWVLLQRLREAGIKMETNCKVEEITGERVNVSQGKKAVFFEADTVILACGMVSKQDLAQELAGKVKELHIIGDSAQPGKIVQATESGFRTAYAL